MTVNVEKSINNLRTFYYGYNKEILSVESKQKIKKYFEEHKEELLKNRK